ncbi:MAG: tyrosine/phenylalanine carboxypeptidase domain-containing protein [Candidatus Saccharimonadales bacterium]
MLAEIPNVTTLEYIAPTPGSVRSHTFEYEKIDAIVAQHRPHETARLRKTFEAEEGSFAELEAARQQAFQYLLFSVNALKHATTPENRDRWSKRYTQASSELYGVPEQSLAQQLYEQQQSDEKIRPFEAAATAVGEYLETKYADAYVALELDGTSASIPIEKVADKFERALAVLAQDDDGWSDWRVDRDASKAQMQVVAKSKRIIIGMNGVDVTPAGVKGLFSHEVLVHALRAVNDEKAGSDFASGLPGYLDADEGLGVFVEYAITGSVPDKIVDRYVDIAYALGQIDGVQHTRQELIHHVMQRASRRNETASSPKTAEQLISSAYNHVNRIYRGSRGDEHIGIYTKDIAYYVGFMKIGNYLLEELHTGKSISDIMTYVLAGRFDPTLVEHQEYINSRLIQ